jgi:hypothetical protein
MQQLIDVIRAAIGTDATTEQKAAGVLACRTIATALDTEPGKPLALPGTAPTQGGPRVSIDQVLDLVIARLSMMVTQHEHPQALPETTATTTTPPAVAQPINPVGLRVPLAPTNGLKVKARPHPPPLKSATRSAHAPVTSRKP